MEQIVIGQGDRFQGWKKVSDTRHRIRSGQPIYQGWKISDARHSDRSRRSITRLDPANLRLKIDDQMDLRFKYEDD